jgi:hypothetical protein
MSHPTPAAKNASPRFNVISVALGYPLRLHHLFVGTLRRFYDGDVTLFVSDYPPKKMTCICRNSRMELKAIHSYLREQRVVAHNESEAQAMGLLVHVREQILFSRFLLYARTCVAGVHTACLACDFKDVFFQADPFAAAAALRRSHGAQPDLLMGMEHSRSDARAGDRNVIANSTINRRWIQACYQQCLAIDRSASVYSQPVLNDGALLGTPAGFAAVGRFFAANMDRATQTCHWRFRVHCGDQGVFQVGVYMRAPELAGIGIELQHSGSVGTPRLTQ